MKHTFTLTYRLSPADCDHRQLVERLGAAGCNDALAGIGQPGRIALEFTREANTAPAALFSALAEVKRAVPSADLIEAAPDLVTLSEAADLAAVPYTRMRDLMGSQMTSPVPVHEGSTDLWHLADLLEWLEDQGYCCDDRLLEVSRAAMQVNIVNWSALLSAATRRQMQELGAALQVELT